MLSRQQQLEILRRRMARIDRKYEPTPGQPSPHTPVTPASERPKRERLYVEEWLSGEAVTTNSGVHYQTFRFWERHRRHGSMDISTLAELPEDLLDEVSEQTVPAAHPLRWVYLDTETTGLAGGTGTYAFLIGIGYATPQGFRVKQYFLREPGEEASALEALCQDLEPFDVLVTYNGKAFDQPLLETRFRMSRMKPPFERMAHLDLLYGARRLWKLRLDSCRLIELENQILGVERDGDVPGEIIPYIYFDYLRKGEIDRLVPVFHHNAIDILTLACLTAIVPHAFRDPASARLVHGAEMIGIARWMRKAERHEDALGWMREAITRRLNDELLYRTMWDIAQLERKVGREAGAVAMYSELAQIRNPHRIAALEELAKYYEHRERNYTMALEFTREALRHAATPELQHRAGRLERKAAAQMVARAIPRLV
ncbi:MAG: ribonuclease H-like domain-containing protein [Acidobacteria bacterium]|nr:ribonuclease H-like domain-containing protein [Acidobacteriota bacterium]